MCAEAKEAPGANKNNFYYHGPLPQREEKIRMDRIRE
jgi:hypothetical protein